ncbi:unnamed protein product [Rhodiola kirilowii]
MRVHMRVSEAADSRVRRGLLRISVGQEQQLNCFESCHYFHSDCSESDSTLAGDCAEKFNCHRIPPNQISKAGVGMVVVSVYLLRNFNAGMSNFVASS